MKRPERTARAGVMRGAVGLDRDIGGGSIRERLDPSRTTPIRPPIIQGDVTNDFCEPCPYVRSGLACVPLSHRNYRCLLNNIFGIGMIPHDSNRHEPQCTMRGTELRRKTRWGIRRVVCHNLKPAPKASTKRQHQKPHQPSNRLPAAGKPPHCLCPTPRRRRPTPNPKKNPARNPY